MKRKGLVIAILTLSIVFVQAVSIQIEAQEGQKPVVIPKQVKDVLTTGMDSRQGRMDIPFSIIEHFYLPAAQNIHNIFMFKVKNADLGYAAAVAGGEVQEKPAEVEPAFQATPTQLKANSHLFLSFKQLDGEYAKDVYIPINLQIEGASYDSEKEEVYSVGYPMPAGKFVVGIAITSQDLSRIGTQYFEYETPGPASFTQKLGVTPVFFVKELKRVSAPETTTEIHKDFFTYSILQITPNLEKAFETGELLDIFFILFGAQPNESNQFDIVIDFEVVQGDEVVIKYGTQAYPSPLISQELPLTRSTVTTSTDEAGETKEKRETKPLDPGTYTLNIKIKDNLSGRTEELNIDFTKK